MSAASDRDQSADIGGEVVVPCHDLETAVARYQAVGFTLNATGPADAPVWADMSVPGLRLHLTAASSDRRDGSPYLRLFAPPGGDPAPPDHVEFADPGPHRLVVPPTVASLAVSHETDGTWGTGRAGMRYRDLIPDRYGGAYIASHIHIPDGGPVPDYVHHHLVAYQLIFCHRGWVRVVYQDQGEPFVMNPGDCVLQPPGIRHQVLEASDDLYVTELSCPADHRTSLDHDLTLPNDTIDRERRFGGQHFVRHVTAEMPWAAERTRGYERQDTAIEVATGGLVAVRLVRSGPSSTDRRSLAHQADLYLLFVVSGRCGLVRPDGTVEPLVDGSSATVPAGHDYAIVDPDPGAVLLEVVGRAPERG